MEEAKVKQGTCFFGHKWTKWELHDIERIHFRNGKEFKGVNSIQIRRCVRCNKFQKEDI